MDIVKISISTMDIKIFTNVRGTGQGLFFLHINILFYQCSNINIIDQQFYRCLRYIFYTYISPATVV